MTSIKRCKSLVGDFYKRFILKDSRYIGYSPCCSPSWGKWIEINVVKYD